jgi:ComF family protein
VLKELCLGLIDLVYPPHCYLCKTSLSHHSIPPREGLCPRCQSSIILNTPPFCVQCSRHLDQPQQSSKCVICREHHLSFDFAWSACLYEPPLKNLIHDFKYHEKTHLQFCFAQLVTAFINEHEFDIRQFDMLIPIPLSPLRLRERGFNQSEILAKHISKEYNIALNTKNLIRRKNSRPQASLSAKDRWTNIQGAFTIKHSNDIKNKSVLLIDDLLTTGATASEAAKTLKQFGANSVGVITLAITSGAHDS